MDRAAVEATISQRLQAGALEDATSTAIRCYGPELLGYLMGMLRDEELARDAFGELCEDLWRGLPGFRRECSFRTWFYKLAWNRAQQLIATPHARRERRLETREISELVASVRSVASTLHSQAVRGQVARLRAALEPDELTLLSLRIDRELAWRDVAHVLDIDEAVARKRFERIKAKLRELAEREGLVDG